MREKYILSEKEIESLLEGYVTVGPAAMYEKLKTRAMANIDSRDDIDELLLDQSEAILKRGRETVPEDVDNKKEIVSHCYSIYFIMKRLAHQIYREYKKMGKERKSDRFLRLVIDNPSVPLEE